MPSALNHMIMEFFVSTCRGRYHAEMALLLIPSMICVLCTLNRGYSVADDERGALARRKGREPEPGQSPGEQVLRPTVKVIPTGKEVRR